MLRIGGAATLFSVVRLARGGRAIERRDLGALAGLSLLGVVLNQVLFLEGVQRTTAIHTNILITTIPAFTLGIAMLLGRERGNLLKVAGIALAGAGAAYLALVRGGAAEGATMAGDLLIVMNSLCYAGYLVYSRDVLKRVEPLTLVTWVFLIGTVLVAPLGVPALARTKMDLVSLKTILVLGYIVLFPSFLVYLTSIWSLKRAPSSLVAIYVYVQPVVTAIVAPLVLGELVTPRAGVAALVIFAGLGLATKGMQRGEKPARLN